MPPRFHEVSTNLLGRNYNSNDEYDTFFFQITFVENTQATMTPLPSHSQDPTIIIIFNDFADVSDLTSGLSPTSPTNHKIVIHQGARPIKACPYSYTRFQKEEMGGLVFVMLEEGNKQPSQSPYSSPLTL